MFGELLGEGQFGRVVAATALNIGGLQGCVKVTKMMMMIMIMVMIMMMTM